MPARTGLRRRQFFECVERFGLGGCIGIGREVEALRERGPERIDAWQRPAVKQSGVLAQARVAARCGGLEQIQGHG